ncbi:MAG: ATP-binding protein [Bacteroidota bacterium]
MHSFIIIISRTRDERHWGGDLDCAILIIGCFIGFYPMFSFKAIVGFLFGLLVVTIGVLTGLSYQNNEGVVRASLMVSHTDRVIVKAEEISSTFKDAQLVINNMIIRRDTSKNAAEYVSAMKALFVQVRELRQLLADSSQQQLNISLLEMQLKQFGDISDSIVTLIATKLPAETILTVFSSKKNLRDDVALKIRKIKDVEKMLLTQREVANRESVEAFTRTFILLLIGMVILLVATFLVVRYNYNESKAAERKMKQALEVEVELNKLKSNFVTLASHEFRTPLTTILSSAFLLERYSFAEEEKKARKHLTRIKSSVNNLTSILDEFLSITRIEEDKVQPTIEKIDLQEYMRTICCNLQTFAKPGQIIHYSHSGENVISTDPVLLGNILTNLVTNAIKYSGENSPIYVMSMVNNRVHLTVKDSGIGIPDDDQKHLFERFYRASNVGAVQGTGLGLHIMKHYVEMLKGSVKLKSKLGEGTEVDIILGLTSSFD